MMLFGRCLGQRGQGMMLRSSRLLVVGDPWWLVGGWIVEWGAPPAENL